MKSYLLSLLCLVMLGASAFAQSNSSDPQSFNHKKAANMNSAFSVDRKGSKMNPQLRIAINQSHKNSEKNKSVLMQRLDSIIFMMEDSFTGGMVNAFKAMYNYNDDLLMSSLVQQDWYGDWENSWKEEHFFNDMDLTDHIVSYEFTENHWQQYMKEEMLYTPDGSMLSYTVFDWQVNRWEPSMKSEYSYTENTTTDSSYVKDGNAWILVSVRQYTYNNGKLVLETGLSLSMDTGEMMNDVQVVYTYDNDNLVTKNYQWWLEDAGVWSQPMERDEYNYDNYNNMYLHTYSYFNEMTSDWEMSEQYDQEYNNDYSFDELILPQGLDTLDFRHMMTLNTLTFYEEGEPYEGYIGTLYYTPVMIESASNLSLEEANIFPNPASESVTISWNNKVQSANLTIYNSTGMLVSQSEIKNQSTIPVSHLGKGMFFYTLSNNGKVLANGKMMVQ